MNWGGWSNFIHMGGYGFYVWGSFGVTAVLIVGELVMLRMHARKALDQARRAVKFGRVVEDDDEVAA